MTTPLHDFKARLAGLREAINANRRRFIELGNNPTKCPMLTEAWDATVLQAGVDYLATAQHLAPARHLVRPGSPRYRAPILAMEVRPSGVGEHGESLLCDRVAASVGLHGEVLARLVAEWMTAHGALEPLAPWRLECEHRGVKVAEPRHARWTVRDGSKRWTGLPVSEAQRLCLSGDRYRAELDIEATMRAAGL